MTYTIRPLFREKDWSKKLWAKAVNSWRIFRDGRSNHFLPDVILPVICKALERIPLINSFTILDIGCGDVQELLLFKKWLDSNNLHEIRILGVDCQSELLSDGNIAIKNYYHSLPNTPPNIHLANCDISDLLLLKKLCQTYLNKSPELVKSILSLHDDPDLQGILRCVSNVLEDGGYFLAIIVNPDWTENLKQLGLIKSIRQNESSEFLWRWKGLFPINGVNSIDSFYLPHFHRNIDDYLKAFEQNYFEIVWHDSIDLETSLDILDRFSFKVFLMQRKSRNS